LRKNYLEAEPAKAIIIIVKIKITKKTTTTSPVLLVGLFTGFSESIIFISDKFSLQRGQNFGLSDKGVPQFGQNISSGNY